MRIFLFFFIFQALNLIDHLIRNGSPRIIDDTRDRIEKLRSLQDFSFKEQQYERGNGSACYLEWIMHSS